MHQIQSIVEETFCFVTLMDTGMLIVVVSVSVVIYAYHAIVILALKTTLL